MVKQAVAKTDKVNVVRSADNFIATGISRDVLETKVRPAIDGFLAERGLSLSKIGSGGVFNREIKQLMLRHAFKFVDSVIFRVGTSTDDTGNKSFVYRIDAASAASGLLGGSLSRGEQD